MRLVNLERAFTEEYGLDKLKEKTIEGIKNVLDNYENNFLKDSIEQLPQGVLFKELKIEYRTTCLILNKANGAKPSFRLIFDLIAPQNGEELFTYEIEYNCDGEYSDDFFLDY